MRLRSLEYPEIETMSKQCGFMVVSAGKEDCGIGYYCWVFLGFGSSIVRAAIRKAI